MKEGMINMMPKGKKPKTDASRKKSTRQETANPSANANNNKVMKNQASRDK
jgi:hypothetical protein